jgi:hypothetical protein
MKEKDIKNLLDQGYYVLFKEGFLPSFAMYALLDADSSGSIRLNPEAKRKINLVLEAKLETEEYYDLVADVYKTRWVFESSGLKHKLHQCYHLWACPLF